MSTKKVTKSNVKSESLIEATLGNFWAFWDFDDNTPAYNPGRDDSESWGHPEAEIPRVMSSGFDLAKGTMVALPEAEAKKAFAALAKLDHLPERKAKLYAEIAKNPAKVAADQRKRRIAELREKPDAEIKYSVPDPNSEDESATVQIAVTNAQVADVLEYYQDSKIELFVVCGQRRGFAAPWTVALWETEHESEYAFYLTPRDFESPAKLHSMLAEENDRTGKREYSPVGLLRNAIQFLRETPTLRELELGEKIGMGDVFDPKTERMQTSNRGNRQKYYRWAKLAILYPELDIAERVRMQPALVKSGERKGKPRYDKGGWIPAAKLDKEDCQVFLGKASKHRPNSAAVMGASKGDKVDRKATPAEVEAYFRMLVTDAKPKTIGRSDLESWEESAHVADRQVRLGDVLRAIRTNDFEFFNN